MTTRTPRDQEADRTAPDPGPLLVDIHALAALLGRSVASLERDQAARRLPAPVRIGGSRKWRRAEIEEWVADGCPSQSVWTARRPNR